MSNKYGNARFAPRRFSRNKRFALISPREETRIYIHLHIVGHEKERKSASAGSGLHACTYVHGYNRPSLTPAFALLRHEREGEDRRRALREPAEGESGCGSGSCDCFGFDLGSIYRVYARICALPLLSTTLFDATLRLERNRPREHTHTYI